MLQLSKIDHKSRLFVFFCLYIAQSIPMSFFSAALPVMMRQTDFSLSAIAMLQIMKLPWLLKFIWSPMVDRTTVSLRDYQKWIMGSELIYAILILIVGFLDMQQNMGLVVVLIASSFFASATQDIATDALATRLFSGKGTSSVNSIQSMGSFIGSLLGGGLLLMLFNKIGWNGILPALSIFVVIAGLPLFLVRMKLHKDSQGGRKKANLLDIFSFFTQKKIGKQIGYLLLCYSGVMGTMTMVRPLMVDLGYTMEQVGLISGIWGPLMAFVFSFLGGLIVKRKGVLWSRRAFAIIVLMVASLFWINSVVGFTKLTLIASIMALWSAYALSMVVVYTSSMDCARQGREGTDFTLQTVLTHLGSMIVAMMSGKVADMMGYEGMFSLQVIFASVALMYVFVAFRNNKKIISIEDGN